MFMFSALHSGSADPFAEVEGLSSAIIKRLEGQAGAGATEHADNKSNVKL